MVDLGVLSGGDYSEALDVNNSGQVVGYSNNEDDDWRPFLYEDGQMIDLNSLLPAESGWTLEFAYAINDRGEIVGEGSFEGRERGFLLDPLNFTATALDGVTVGNISTLGDSIDLQGLKLTLTGEKITTEGGDISLDSPTLLDSETDTLSIDSTDSSDAEAVGDLTFQKTIDGESGGTQSLILEAGQGNITFEGAVGSESPLKDLTVNGAQAFAALEEISTSGGDVNIAVEGNITTHKISSENGSVSLISTQGKIVAYGAIASTKGGVAILAIQDISTQSIYSENGGVVLSSHQGSITTNGDINTTKGNVAIAAGSDISTAKISTQTGSVSLISSSGSIDVHDDITTKTGYADLKAAASITTENIATKNGYIDLKANDNVTTGQITSLKKQVSLSSNFGAVSVNGEIVTNNSYANIEAQTDVAITSIQTNGGGITLISHSGQVSEGFLNASGINTDGEINIFTPNSTAVAALADDGILMASSDLVSLGEANEFPPSALDSTQEQQLSDFVHQLWNLGRPLAEFILGTIYQWLQENNAPIEGLLPPFLKLSDKEKAYWNNVVLPQSKAFKLGQLFGAGAAIVQGIIEFIGGSASEGGGGGLCITGIGCFAGAPAIAVGVVLQVHGAKLATEGASEAGELFRELLRPSQIDGGGATGAGDLARELGVSKERIDNALSAIPPEKIRQLDSKLGDEIFKPLLDKSKELISNVSRSLDLIGNDTVALDDIRTVLAHKKGKITENDMKNAFSQMRQFLEKYHGKVSGANANRFAKANTKALDDVVQAKGEIKTAENLLDGHTLLGKNVDELYGIPEITGQKNPDFLVTMKDGINRLVEVKTPEGQVVPQNINKNLGKAIDQIVKRVPISNPTGKAYIRLDYRNAPATTNRRDWLFEKVKTRLEFDDNGKITPGVDVVEFVEVFYKDANQGSTVQKLEIQIQSGIVKLLN
jgi:probable HAF family extracellular repeat protein